MFKNKCNCIFAVSIIKIENYNVVNVYFYNVVNVTVITEVNIKNNCT